MIKLNLKNKLVFILSIALVFLAVFICNTYASNSTVYNTLPGDVSSKIINTSIIPELKDMNYECFIWYHRSLGYMVWFFDKTSCSQDFKIRLDSGKWYCSGSCSGKEYNFNNNGDFVSSGNLKMSNGRWDEFHNSYLYIQNMTVYETNGDVFFQGPPFLVLPQEMGVEEIPKTIQNLLIILVPVGLIIFGLLLAPYLIKYRN